MSLTPTTSSPSTSASVVESDIKDDRQMVEVVSSQLQSVVIEYILGKTVVFNTNMFLHRQRYWS